MSEWLRSEDMRLFRKWNLIGLIASLCGVLIVSAQTPAPPSGDSDSAGPARERRLVQKLEQAKQLLAPREPKAKPDEPQALRLLQALLHDGAEREDGPETDDVFLDVPDGERRITGRSLKGEARRLIGGMSVQGRQAYEVLVGKGARMQLTAALTNGDWPEVEAVARRFFHTAAGYDATVALGLRELDLGESLSAACRFEEVRACSHARMPREPLLSLRLALAWRLSGRDERCHDVLVELKRSFGDRAVERRNGGDLPWFVADADALGWLDRWAGVPVRPVASAGERRDEWPLVAGNAARNAVAAAAIPVEQVAWSRSLLDDDDDAPLDEHADPNVPTEARPDRSPTLLRGAWGRVRTEVRSDLERRRQWEQPAVIAAQPIVVGNTVVVRSLSQLQAFRATDGEPLWHSATVDPQLAEMLGEVRRGRVPRRVSSEMESWLQQRVWEDVGNATLSSDGELVFALQERESSMRAPQVAWRGMFVTREFNKLFAIEAATGRLRWEIGGPRGDYELSGSGAFFLGPPLPWRGQLFVLTDDGIDLRLAVLDPHDGKLLWTQTLMASDPIWSGSVRDAGLSPTIAGDCVVCPTGAGAIVAVDPVRRELRWQSVYRQPLERTAVQQRFHFTPFQPPVSGFESSWHQSVLVTARDRVLVAAPDFDELLCLDARDGHELWRQPRGDGIFLAGIVDQESVLIVGANEVRSVRSADGKSAWPRTAAIAPPAGRGVLIDGMLHLPLISGEVVSIDSRTGRTLARRELADKDFLGNLIAAEGRLVSQSATHIAAFPSLRQQQQAIAAALRQNPDDAAALEERGRMNLHLGRRAKGLEDLRRAIALRPTSDAKQALAGLMLEEVRNGQAADWDATIRELETLLDDPKQRLLFVRLRAGSLQSRGELLLAARELLKLADAWEQSGELEITNGSTSARQDRWIAAELLELHKAMSAEDRRLLNGEVATRLQTALAGTGPAQLRDFLALFGWSEAASPARRALVGRIDPRKQRHEYEALLLAEGQGFGAARLAQQWLSLGQFEMARPLINDLATRFADEKCLEAKSGRDWAKQWRAEFTDRLTNRWPVTPIKSERVSTSESLKYWHHLDWSAPLDLFHENWQLWRDAPNRDAIGRDAVDCVIVARNSFGREQWRSKLPFENFSTPHLTGLSATWHARWLVLNLGDRFLVFDTLPPVQPEANAIPEPRLMWQSVLYDRRWEQNVTLIPFQYPSPIAGMPTQIRLKDSSDRPLGRVAIVGHDVVCHQAGHRLIASNLTNGELLWMFDGLPLGCELSGDARAVMAISRDGRDLFVLNSLDGRLIARREQNAAPPQVSVAGKPIPKSAARLASLNCNQLTWFESELRLSDAVTDTDLLRERFPVGTLPCVSLGDAVAMLEPTGRFTIWSLRDGQRLLEQMLPPIPHVTHFVVLRDHERWLLLTNVEEPLPADKPRPRVTPLNLDHWRVHGPAFGFDRATGQQLWTTTLDWHALQAAQPADSPVLLLASRVHNFMGLEQRVGDQSKFHVSVLDKRDGRIVPLATDLRPAQTNFADIRPNIADKIIEVQIERELHRLMFEAP